MVKSYLAENLDHSDSYDLPSYDFHRLDPQYNLRGDPLIPLGSGSEIYSSNLLSTHH